MANEAHKEPTMEEILASIRKIISDDEPGAPSAPAAPTLREVSPEPMNDYEDIEDATVGDLMDDTDQAMFEAEDEPEPEPEPVAAPVATKLTGPEFTFEEMLGSVRQAVGEAAEAAAQAAPSSVTPINRPAPESHAAPVLETAMPASARYAQTILTDEHTADVAAGALGKLISKMEIRGDNTIEGLVKEMLKPMIKDWLDANLANIVEEKVEAEVQRIARMAR
jgi:uncharacterized protein